MRELKLVMMVTKLVMMVVIRDVISAFFRGIIFDDLFWIFHENTRLYSFTKFPITLF